MSSALCAASPVDSNVLILEDEPRVSTRLVGQLAEHKVAACTVAGNVAGLKEQVRHMSFEAVSIDWELDGYFVGEEVLRILQSAQPAAATVVYTKHRRVLSDARSRGVDECLLKVDRRLGTYLDAVRRGVRLGHARHIAAQLVDLGAVSVPAFPPGRPLDEEAELALCALGRSEAARRAFAGSNGFSLVSLLVRRGWWKPRRADIVQYAALPTVDKLKALLDMVDVSSDDLAKILDVSRQEAEALLGRTHAPEAGAVRPGSESHRLLAVLSSLLELASYQPDLMAELWESRGIYGGTAEAPPWDSLGLRRYLCAGGPPAVADCLYWLRSH